VQDDIARASLTLLSALESQGQPRFEHL